MKRVLSRVVLGGVCMGLFGYAAIAIMAPHPLSASDHWTLLWATMLGGGLFMTLPMLIVGVYSLSIERRLRAGFRLTDLFPGVPAYERTVQLCVSPGRFLMELRHLIAERLVVLACRDSPDDPQSLDCTVRFRVYYQYDIRAQVSPSGTAATIAVRRLGPLAWLATVEVLAAQILAGLVKWAADHDLVASDFGPFSLPERLDKDLGNWLPTNDEWRSGPLRPYAPIRRPRFGAFRVRILIAGMATLLAFFGLTALDTPEFPIPRSVTSLPALLFAIYALRQLARREEAL